MGRRLRRLAVAAFAVAAVAVWRNRMIAAHERQIGQFPPK
jgi:hypothetical protein